MARTSRELFFFDNTWTPQAGTSRAWISTLPMFYPKIALGGPTGSSDVFLTDAAGGLFYSGANLSGSGGINSITAASSPTAVVGGLTWLSVMRYSCSYGLDSQYRMYAWGSNSVGQQGTGNTTITSSPTIVAGGLKWRNMCYVEHGSLGVAEMTGGSSFGGIDALGTAYTWGANNFGQLGTNVAGGATSSPVAVVGGKTWIWMAKGAVASITGGIMSLVDNAGAGYMCGLLNAGSGGNGVSSQVVSSPVAVIGGLKFQLIVPVAGASGGGQGCTVLGFTTTNQMIMWGANNNGCCGTGFSPGIFPNFSTPQIVGGGANLQWLATPGTWATTDGGLNTGNTVFAIASDFTLYAWGKNANGILGTNDNNDYSSPVAVVGGLKWQQVFAAGNTVYGITTGGDMYGWGGNTNGQIGDGTTTNRSSPVLVTGGLKWAYGMASMTTFTNNQFVVAVDLAGRSWGWGINANGQLGSNSVTTVSSPVALVGAKQWNVMQFSNYSLGQGIDVNVNATYPILISKQNATFPSLPPLGPASAMVVEYEQ